MNTHDPDWRERALCREVGMELFFPVKGESNRPAKSICARCVVVAECLEDALRSGMNFGVWGGMSVRERQRLSAARDREAGITHPQSANLKGAA